MIYETKLKRANELHEIIVNSKAELEALFGHEEAPKRGRPRKNGNGDSRPMEATLPLGADTPSDQSA